MNQSWLVGLRSVGRRMVSASSLALCASLFENCVDIHFIRKTKRKWADRYFHYEQVEKYYRALRVLREKRLPRGMRKQYARYKSELQPQVEPYLKHFPRKNSGWSQRTLENRAISVGLYWDYLTLYWVFCAHKHTLPMVAGSLLMPTPTGIDLIYAPNVKGVYPALVHSNEYFLSTCAQFDKPFQLGKNQEIVALRAEHDKAAEEVKLRHPEVCD